MSFHASCVIKNNNSTRDAILIHGFRDSKVSLNFLPIERLLNKQGYNIIKCDARGHGSRLLESGELEWNKTLEEYKAFIEQRRKETGNSTALIGISMGGTTALTIGLLDPKIEKVIAISSLHDNTLFKSDTFSKIWHRRYFTDFNKAKIIDQTQNIFPNQLESCMASNKDKFYLIHNIKDGLIPYSEFEKNKASLCLPDENTLSVSSFLGHSRFVFLPSVSRFLDFVLQK